MGITDLLAVYGAVLSTCLLTWVVYVYFKDRHKVVLDARFVPEVESFIIEVVNAGRRPITVVGGGVAAINWGLGSHPPGYSWPADAGFPRRLGEGDSMYAQLWWNSDVRGCNQAGYAWVRDARGVIHKSPIKDLSNVEIVSSESAERCELTTAEMARLFNSAVQLDDMIYSKARLAYIEAKYELFKLRAEREQEQKHSAAKPGKRDRDDNEA